MAAILILANPDDAVSLTSELHGHALTFAPPSDDSMTQAASGQFDIVIAPDEQNGHHFLQQIHSAASVAQRPFMLLWQKDQTAASSDLAFVQGCITPATAAAQVQTCLKLRDEISALYTRAQAYEHEISTLKSAQTELELLKNAIVKNVSHELKTPLMHVKAAVAMMREPSADQEKLIEYATNATSRLEAIVKNITMLGDSLDINPGPVIVREAIEAARRNLYRTWESRDQTDRIKSDLGTALPPAYADRQGLITVLQLLIDNALKFSTKEVHVHAHLSTDESRIVVSVQDYGIGIARDKINGIFQSFFQVDGSSTRRFGGTGVGLSIVKLILDYHDSHIEVESEVNQGSTFRFTLPIVKVDAR